ncbi:MAG: alpha-L-fucosidase [Chthonomonadales bacterium]|nr:alpha-L-fucosidase [Chthonomonadales bacterium]
MPSLWLAVLVVLLSLGLGAQETPAQFAARTKWWREAKFGMFIHWGVYSVPASAKGGAEWYLHGSRMQVKDYEKFAPQFNPVRFDAARWVRTAKQAGMKYIVITSKHHDGFCMFDSNLTDWCITKATPFKRDPLKELAAECRKQGIRLGFYHSIMDWHHPDYLPRREWEKETRPAAGASLDRYIDYMKGQLTELLTNYGPVAVLWFDGGWEHNAQELRSAEVNAMIRKLQPRIIINDRNQLPEDHSTPEQTIPAGAMPNGRLWETCMTINDTWGYTRDNTNWKSTEDLVRKLCDIAHKGGNFLLNVGPTELGEFPQPIVERLHGMGAWLSVNGAAIYGTTQSPWKKLPFDGRCTAKGNRLYLHVFQWPADGLSVSGLKTPVRLATALGSREKLRCTVGSRDGHPTLSISRPAKLDPIATVIELQLAGRPVVEDPATVVKAGADGTLTLRAADAVIHGSAQYESGGGHDNIGFWTNPQDYVSWEIELIRPGDYRVALTYACQPGNEGSEYHVTLGLRGGGNTVSGKVEATGSWTDFRTVDLGHMSEIKPGRYTLTVKPTSMPRGAVMNLKEVRLTPITET